MPSQTENPIIIPSIVAKSPEVKATSLLPVEVLNATSLDDDDDCVICYQTLYRPVKTLCGHAACESCMLNWALTAMQSADREAELPANTGMTVYGIKFKCPTCRTYTEALFDEKLDAILAAKHPEEYAIRAAEEAKPVVSADDDSTQSMFLMFGNSYRKVEPSISPYTGKIREHEWTFFTQSSRQDVIELVHIILHPTYREDRLITLTSPPFSATRLAWGYFTVFAGIQLKEGYEWVDEERAVDSNPEKGRVRDRLPIDWRLDFGGNGSQRNKIVKFRQVLKKGKEKETESSEGEEDLSELALLMSEAEIRVLREVRRLKAAAAKAAAQKA